MAEAPDIARYRANWQDEIESAALYQAIAESEQQPQLAEVYRRLAAVEEQHAQFWEAQLRDAGQAIPPRAFGWRTRTLIALARRFGPQFVLPTISSLEQADDSGYRAQPEARGTPPPVRTADPSSIKASPRWPRAEVKVAMAGAAVTNLDPR